MALLNIDQEKKLFLERIEDDFYSVERAKNSGEDYVLSGKLARDTKAVEEFASSSDFDIIRNLG